MEHGGPSRTAWGAAGHRAAHQVLEDGRIFRDPLALRILGEDADGVVDNARATPRRTPMRIFIAVRHQVAEDALARHVADGTRQVVVLGAGLDTFAYRNPFADNGVRVFEVDHPATQEWKRDTLARTGIPIPDAVTFAPVDFETDDLATRMAASGVDLAAPTFFLWLGVVPYLTREAVGPPCASRRTSAPPRSACAGSAAPPTPRPAAAATWSWPPDRSSAPAGPAPRRHSRPRPRRGRCP